MSLNWDQMTAFGFSIGAIWLAAKKWLDKIKPYIVPMVEQAEQRAKDGLIDLDDRKMIVMAGVNALEKDGKIKLNFITRYLVSKVVDRVAQRLPDFEIKIEEGKK